MTTAYFTTPGGNRLAFRRRAANSGQLTFVWMCGFKSDMTGSKVMRLEDWAVRTGHGFLAFDYSGHGQSGGAFEDGTVSQWRADALAAINTQTEGRIVLVGSSMGGWIALLSALARPDRVKGLVLIAPAPDFTEKLMWPEFSAAAQAEVMQQGYTLRPSDYDEPYTITRALIEDGRQWQILDAPIAFDGPVRILQGMQDADVPWTHAARLVHVMTADDLTLTLIKDGDHRLSREQDIARLIATCDEMATALA